jgi:hypothetical protein
MSIKDVQFVGDIVILTILSTAQGATLGDGYTQMKCYYLRSWG